MADPAVINGCVAFLGASQQQRAVRRHRDLFRTDTGAQGHVGGVGGPEAEQQLRAESGGLPVPAECEGGVTGSGQQGALQGGVLSNSHLNSPSSSAALPPEV